jgi:hypothetical protein
VRKRLEAQQRRVTPGGLAPGRQIVVGRDDDPDVVERALVKAAVDSPERSDVELARLRRRDRTLLGGLEVAVLDRDVLAEPQVNGSEQPAAAKRRPGDHVLLAGVGDAPAAQQVEDDVLVFERGRHALIPFGVLSRSVGIGPYVPITRAESMNFGTHPAKVKGSSARVGGARAGPFVRPGLARSYRNVKEHV